MAEITKDTNAKTKKVEKPDMVTIKLPRIKGESDSVWVSVNMDNWQIKRGVEVEVPYCVAEVLKHQEEMLEKIAEFEEKNAK